MRRWACTAPDPETHAHTAAQLQDVHLSCACKQSHAHVDHSHAPPGVCTGPPCQMLGHDVGNRYFEDPEEAQRSYSPKRCRFVVYAAVVQPPDGLLPSVNRADPGSQIPTEWCPAGQLCVLYKCGMKAFQADPGGGLWSHAANTADKSVPWSCQSHLHICVCSVQLGGMLQVTLPGQAETVAACGLLDSHVDETDASELFLCHMGLLSAPLHMQARHLCTPVCGP